MPLDPQIAQVLQALQAMPPMETMTLEELRNVYPPPTEREPVGEEQELLIPSAQGGIPARLYRPRTMERTGLTVFFHGGGFVIGSIESHDAACRRLCNLTGAAVLSVGYRLAPEHRFPAAPDDALQAARWAARQAPAWGLDAGRLVLAGDSAGGALAAVTALRLRDEGGPRAAGQVLVYPMTDYHTPPTPSYLQYESGYFLTRAAMVRFWKEYLPREEDASHPHASPLRAPDLSGLPPALVLTAEFDPLRDEGERFAHRLLDAGVPVTLRRQNGLIHGFFRMSALSDRARSAVEDTAQWIRQAMA
ncbi:alpha/beta hydrolase [Pseudorhodoferax sp.]|uniref:alpha/beta hydrolase n=1 Tax=Pseudorhodoferax sp. TaxID=1993553 RepID=UPI0039E2501C